MRLQLQSWEIHGYVRQLWECVCILSVALVYHEVEEVIELAVCERYVEVCKLDARLALWVQGAGHGTAGCNCLVSDRSFRTQITWQGIRVRQIRCQWWLVGSLCALQQSGPGHEDPRG